MRIVRKYIYLFYLYIKYRVLRFSRLLYAGNESTWLAMPKGPKRHFGKITNIRDCRLIKSVFNASTVAASYTQTHTHRYTQTHIGSHKDT